MEKETMQKVPDVLAKVNPLMLVNWDGAPVIYENDTEAYFDALNLLFATFPRGYIDVPIFMLKYQHILRRRAQDFCGRKDIVIIPLYDVDAPQRIDKLRDLFTILLKPTGCKLNESALQAALCRFDINAINAHLKERVEDGSIIQFCKDYAEGKKDWRVSEY